MEPLRDNWDWKPVQTSWEWQLEGEVHWELRCGNRHHILTVCTSQFLIFFCKSAAQQTRCSQLWL